MSVSFKSSLLGCTCFTFVSALGVVGSAAFDGAVLPQNGAFEAGAGTFAEGANGLMITQSTNRGIVSWSDFSIGRGGAVHFANGSGATLNRVTGAHLSQIDGHLSASGSLFLLNPNGVLVGETGRIETGGDFVASTLMPDLDAFMADGTLALKGDSAAGIVNLGQIASSAGDILLAAHSVRNEGDLAAAGEVSLVAAHELTFRDAGVDNRLLVRPGMSGDVTHAGTMEGAAARLEAVGGNVYALAGNTEGVKRAAIVARDGGRIRLAAANLAHVGGEISSANAVGDGGKITVEGTHIHLSDSAELNAVGGRHGGTVHVGGGWQGQDASLNNASATYVADGARIDVSGETGAGGEAVVWADGSTLFEGSVSATGGADRQGGHVEVSGKGHLAFRGDVDTGGGVLLLDPTDLEIVSSVSGVAGQIVPSGGDFLALQSAAEDTSQLAASDLSGLLETNNVLVTTQNANGSGNGDITVSAAIERTAGTGTTLLTLNAERDLIINARLGSDDASRPLAVALSAGRDTSLNASVETQGGVFNAATGNNFTVGAAGAIHTAGGALSIATDSDLDAGGFANGTGLFRVVNGGLLTSGGADIRLESMGIDIAGPSASAIVIDAGAGAVHFNRRGAYADEGFLLSTRNTIGLQNGNYYLWYNDLAKVRANTILANSERRGGYLTMYENYGALNWAENVTGSAQILGSRYFTVYGGLTNINADVVLDHDGSRNSGINSISLGSSPISMNGNLTIKAPGFRINGNSMYVRSANGNIIVKANEMFNQPQLGLRAPKGYISFEGFSAGNYTAPGDLDWFGTPYYGWAASSQAPIVYVGSASDTNILSIGSVSAAQTANITQQLVFRAREGIGFSGNVETGLASIVIQPDTNGDGGALTMPAGGLISAGRDLSLNGPVSSVGAATFRANGNIVFQSQVTTQGDLTVEADKDGDDDGDVSLSPTVVLSTNDGDAVLSAHRFVNQSGNGAIDTGAGRYLIYTASPLSDTSGGLAGARRYNQSYSGLPPSNVLESGNLFFYELAPTLTLRATDASRTYGQANPTLTFVADGAGLIAGDLLADVAAGAVAGTVATTASQVGTYAIDVDLSGLTSKMGYTLQTQSGQLSVTPASLTITADAVSKTYGAADPNLTFSHAGWVNGDSSSLLTGALSRAAGETVAGGPYAIGRGTLSAGSNYTIAYSGADFTIDPATLTVLADAVSKTYGAADPNLTFSHAGWVNGDSSSLLTGALSRAAGETVAGGPYAIGRGTLSAGSNYTIAYSGADFTIDPATLTVLADAVSKTYGAADPNLTFSHAGWVNGDSSSLLTGALSRAAGETVAGGPYAIGRGTLSAGSNYTIAYSGADFTIDPATLTVLANNAERREGENNPPFTASFNGFVPGETPSVLSGSLRFDTPADHGSKAGAYRLTPFGMSSANYQIGFVDGVLTIRPAERQNGPVDEILNQNAGAGRRASENVSRPPVIVANTPGSAGNNSPANDAGEQSGGDGDQFTPGGVPGSDRPTGSGASNSDQPVTLQYTVLGRTVTIKLPASLARLMQQAFSSKSGLEGA